MKKTLLFATFFLGCLLSFSQSLQTENFNGLTVGNIGTDITGATSGQGGWSTYTAVGSNADFQIINEGGAYANAVQITGPANATDTKYLWKDGLDTAWTTRTLGNNVIEVEYDFFTGPATTSKSTTGIRLFNAAGQTIAGFRFVPETKVITGLAKYNNLGTIGTYFFNLGAAGAAVTLNANTWYRIGFAFDKTTGNVTWQGPGFDGYVTGTEIGVDPSEADFLVVAGTANTVATVAKFDNLTIKATPVENLLGIQEVEPIAFVIKLYPNPVNDIINVSTSNFSVSKVEIIDINGRTVKSIAPNNVSDVQINVSDLSAGVYMINIYSENNKTTKKFVKN